MAFRHRKRPDPLDASAIHTGDLSAPSTPVHTPRYGAASSGTHANVHVEAIDLLGNTVDKVELAPDYASTGAMTVYTTSLCKPADVVKFLQKAKDLDARVSVDCTGVRVEVHIQPHRMRWRRVYDLLVLGSVLVAGAAGALIHHIVA